MCINLSPYGRGSFRGISWSYAFALSLLLAAGALCAESVSPLASQEADPKKVASLKALFVYHFSNFTKWPESAFAGKADPIVIGVLGQGVLEGVLELAVRDKKVDDRPLVVRRVAYPPAQDKNTEASIESVASALRQCHILFIGPSQQHSIESVLKLLEGAPVLTVSDIPGFIDYGGMIGLVLRDKRVQFDINRTRIEQTDLRVSSKLLSLAGVVR